MQSHQEPQHIKPIKMLKGTAFLVTPFPSVTVPKAVPKAFSIENMT